MTGYYLVTTCSLCVRVCIIPLISFMSNCFLQQFLWTYQNDMICMYVCIITETIITLGMHFFLRCFRLVMVMTGLCPLTTGNPCDLVPNAVKCEGPIYIEHYLVLLSVVTDSNFSPSTSEEIRNAVKPHADPLLQQCSSKAKHFFMQ